MVLKGGMLMAASDIRQMTRDADLSAHDMANDEESVRDIVASICSLEPDPRDGVVIELESVISREPVRLMAYPLALNLAEKIVTAMQRRETSTRDRDFADLWVASRRHRLAAPKLYGHVRAVALHRQQPLIPMAVALAEMPNRQQSYAAMVERMSYLSPPPERWTALIDGVIEFTDPLLTDEGEHLSHWDPEMLAWT